MGYFKINAVVPDNIMSSGQQVHKIYCRGNLIWEKEPESYIIMTTDSESDAWSPSSVTNSGATLHWEVTGAATYSVDTNLPVFDFSTPGEKVITITSSDDLTGLQTLYLNNNQLTSFDATGLTGLQVLSLVGNQLTSFDATGLTGLRNLYLDNNQLTSFNATGLTGLKDIGLNINQLTTFDATGLIGLENLYLDKNPLTTFDATGLIVLKILYLQYTQLTTTSINNLLDQLLAIGNTSGSYLSLYGQTDGGCGDPAKIAALDAIWGTVYVDACSLPPTYPEVTIGTQTWMSVNLDIDDGLGGIYAYNNDEANVATYGRLYTWDAAMRVAASIEGWHLPSDAEWQTLIDYLGGTSVAGGKLKETGTTHWVSPNTGATNESGFTALPGGLRYTDGAFYNIGYRGNWWSATGYDVTGAWFCRIDYNSRGANRNTNGKGLGYYVRLIKDYPTYTLTVTNGTGDGTYVENTVVEIAADVPASGYQFKEWTGDIQYLASTTSSTTNVTMPAGGISVTATYELIPAETVTIGGEEYETVTIGTQTWLKRNLHFDDSVGGIYSYNNDIQISDVYGYLYTWDAAVRVAASIEGWHLPSDAEWDTLITYLGGEYVAGGKLKEAGTTHWKSPNPGATNESGFTALPSGYRYLNGTFYEFGSEGYWWSATELNASAAWCRHIYYSYSDVYRGSGHKEVGYSIRLIRD